MIHDATGKFSSRWVFPDRSSLALVISKGYIRLGVAQTPIIQHLRGFACPHIGEYAAKTNAIRDRSPTRSRPALMRPRGLYRPKIPMRARIYCPWLFST